VLRKSHVISLNVSGLNGRCMRAKHGFDYWPMHSTPKFSFGLKNYSGETQRYFTNRNGFETFQGECCSFRTRNADTSHVSCTIVLVRP
jgi:hypothetical protein